MADVRIFKKLFRRRKNQEGQGEGLPLRIHGIPPAHMTPEPDDAEIAAQALLEMMSERPAPGPSLLGRGINAIKRRKKPAEEVTTPLHQQGGAGGGSAYYHALAARIHSAHEAERRAAMRYVAYCEQELKKMDDGRRKTEEDNYPLSILNSQLMKHLNTIEREGGELKRRWQHCLATVTVHLMQPTGSDDENDNENEGRTST